MIELAYLNCQDEVSFTNVYVNQDDWDNIIKDIYSHPFVRIIEKTAQNLNVPKHVHYVKVNTITGFRYADNH